jgi:anti-sigma-K factor RskA
MTPKTGERHTQLELCIPYVFGRLNPGNRKQFEAHLATGCELCKRELSELYEATALLPLLIRQEAPPPGLRQRILSRISSRKPEQARVERTPASREGRESVVTPATRPPRSWYQYAAAALGILIIVALVIFVNDLVGTTRNQERTIAQLKGDLQQQNELASILKAPKVEIVSLSGIEPGSSVYGKILWDSSSRKAMLQINEVPVTPEGKEYQLWMLKEQKYFSIGEFQTDSTKAGLLKVIDLPGEVNQRIEGFVLTLEPKGGSPQPTGAIYLRGAR